MYRLSVVKDKLVEREST